MECHVRAGVGAQWDWAGHVAAPTDSARLWAAVSAYANLICIVEPSIAICYSWVCGNYLQFMYNGSALMAPNSHFACCLGDTLASELGILSRSPPILITTLKPVPPGTNGGMSVVGTLASLGGGLFMGVTLAVSLLVESSACRTQWLSVVLPLIAWGTAAGGLGSLVCALFLSGDTWSEPIVH